MCVLIVYNVLLRNLCTLSANTINYHFRFALSKEMRNIGIYMSVDPSRQLIVGYIIAIFFSSNF